MVWGVNMACEESHFWYSFEVDGTGNMMLRVRESLTGTEKTTRWVSCGGKGGAWKRGRALLLFRIDEKMLVTEALNSSNERDP